MRASRMSTPRRKRKRRWADERRGTVFARWRHIERNLPSITRERLRVMNKWLFWLWIFPGVPISIYERNSVAWVVFLSVYAIIIAHLIEWRQEDRSGK